MTTAASMNRRALLALSIALMLVLVLIAAILYGRGAFGRNTTLYFITESASGLTPGTAVKLSGFRIGAVSDLQLEPDLSVMVTLKIPLEDFQRLRKDAKAELKKEDLVQAAAIEINPGRSFEALSADNPRIAFERGRSFGQAAQDLTDRLAPILADVKALTGMLSDRKHGLGPMLKESRAVSRDVAATAAEIRTLASEARARFAAVGAQAQGTLEAASAAFLQLDRTAAKAEQGLGRLDDAMPGLLLKLSGTLDGAQVVVTDAGEIVRGVKQSWPIRNMLPAPSTPPPAAAR